MKTPKKKATAAASKVIRSRIIGHVDVDPRTLNANPLNFRRHPKHQMDALRGSMAELGWVKGILVNKTTGNILDGHARVEEALAQGLDSVPVTMLELTEAEEKLALAVLDPITEMAVRDEQALTELLSGIDNDNELLSALLTSLDAQGGWDPDPAKVVGLQPAETVLMSKVIVTCEENQSQEVLAAVQAALDMFTGVTIAKS